MTTRTASIALAAMATLGSLPAAWAQNAPPGTVQLYGSVTAGYSHKTHQTGGGSLDEIANSQLFASLLGVRATESLGGGMTALIRLEAGVNADTGLTGATVAGVNKFFNRQSFVGLGLGQAGTLTLGRQFHAATDRAIQVLDPYNLGGTSIHSTPLALHGVNRFVGNDSRADNSIKYRFTLPSLGLTAGVSKAFAEGPAGSSAWSADLGQTTRTYGLGLYTIKFNSPNVIAATGHRPEYTAYGLGGNVNLGVVRPYLHYMQTKQDPNTATGAQTKNKILALGLAAPVGPQVMLKGTWTHDKGTNLNGVAARNGSKDTLVASAEYLFSKRTSAYVAYTQSKFKDGYKLDPLNIAALGRDPAASNVSMYTFGMRHDF